MTNNHLNIFKHFHESEQSTLIENNLSRAFAICLKNDALFFSQYIGAIISNDDYEYLFSYFDDSYSYSVDLQVNTNNIELSGFRKAYAIAMTGDISLDMSDFLVKYQASNKNLNLTDVCIRIKDIVFIIEVKRNDEDCRQQLYDQVCHFLEQQIEIVPKNFSWQNTVKIMEQVVNIQKLNKSQSFFVEDFLQLSESKYSHWFPSKPLSQLPPLSDHSPKANHARNARLRQICSHSKNDVLPYSDRMAISVPFGWASEIIPSFSLINTLDYVVFTIWPGNTKGQGWNLFNRSLSWVDKTRLEIGARTFELDIEYHMKFCHFNKFITAINYTDKDLLHTVNTVDNFRNNSGKWTIDNWSTFEQFMDDHFKEEFDWRKRCNWYYHFIETDRTYFTVAFGYEVDLYVPYVDLQSMDKNTEDFSTPADFINSIIDGFEKLTLTSTHQASLV